MEEDFHLSVDAFVRSLAVNNNRPVCMLLGAGASISSGMPSAQRCIWEWKRDIFVTNNPALRESVGEISLPGTRHRIQRWLDQRGNYPANEHPDEYSFYAHECYPTRQDRRSFFQHYVTNAKPHTGYQLLPLLAKADLIRTVWTTNFDNLVSRASAIENLTCIEVGIDSTHRIDIPHAKGELRVVSLHGDYRYDDLKNTEKELQQEETNLHKEFLHEIQDYDLIVIGYSGRDASIMNLLKEAYSTQNACRLFWCGFQNDIPQKVGVLIESARNSGKDAFYIGGSDFDDLLSRVALRQLEGNFSTKAKALMNSEVQPTSLPIAFIPSTHPPTSLVKSNAYRFTFPSQALKLDLEIPQAIDRRAWLNELLPSDKGTAVFLDGSALVFADNTDIQVAFSEVLRSKPLAVEISDADISGDGRIRSLIRRTLVQSIAQHIGANSDGNRRIWDRVPYKNHTLQDTNYRVHQAISLRLESMDGKQYVTLVPEITATTKAGALVDNDTIKLIRTAIYGYQHNQKYDADLKYWVHKISDIDILAKGGGIFRIDHLPIYAGLFQKGYPGLPQEIQQRTKQRGLVVPDANLLFSSLNGKFETKSPNPLKGLVGNRPWDYQLTTSGLSSSIETSVICPPSDATKFKRFLNQLQESSKPKDTERDYLQDFPGFSSAFGLPLTHPNPSDPSWHNLDDAVSGMPLPASKKLAHRICQALDIIRSLHPGSITLIFVPTRWNPHEKIESETEPFNLHDFIKAYAARHGQSTQFVREKTTLTSQPCRVRWWISLALYAKAMRTPWRLDCLDDETAFVGIGYSMDSKTHLENHILLGCSHLYNARGEGLQFRLGRIENPIIRGRNPYMSIDDARRTGESNRQLFFDAKMRLPTRVVVHKRTKFTFDEQRGLLQGLEGVQNIELIEVTIEESLRYLATKMTSQKAEIDNFPITRGAVVLLDKTSALLWVHGVTPNAMNPKLRYYQGKRRIPTPLLIRRYRGQSDISSSHRNPRLIKNELEYL